MLDDFEIKCKKCGNIAVDIKGAYVTETVHYGAEIRVKFTCLSCDYEVEVPVTQNLLSDFDNDLRKKQRQREVEHVRFNKKYRKIGRHEIIEEGAMKSWCDDELCPIRNPETIGDIPANFSDKREFYNPIREEENNGYTLGTLLRNAIESERKTDKGEKDV